MEAWREELYHYGTPRHSGRYPWGSGDRPYQSAGGKINKESVKKNFRKAFTQNIKQGKDKPNISPAEKVVKETRNVNESVTRLASRLDSHKNSKVNKETRDKAFDEAKKMSNDDLRKAIERMNLEDTYVNKKTLRYMNGKRGAAEVLDSAGDVIAIAASVASVIAVVYGIKK